jgi:hypothetical protein
LHRRERHSKNVAGTAAATGRGLRRGIFSFGVPFYGSCGGKSPVDRFFTLVETLDGDGHLLARPQPPL